MIIPVSTFVSLELVLFAVLLKSLQQTTQTTNFNNDKSLENHVLNHGLIFEINCVSTTYCALSCIEDHSCISFNYHNGKRKCRGYETLMLTRDAGTYEEGWMYYFNTINGFCPNMYAFSRLYNYCLGYEGHFLAAGGINKCQGKRGRLPLIRGQAEMRFAGLLAENFRHLSRIILRDFQIQGFFDKNDSKWKDNDKNTLPFTQFLRDKEIPADADHHLFLRKPDFLTNHLMFHRAGTTFEGIVVCTVN